MNPCFQQSRPARRRAHHGPTFASSFLEGRPPRRPHAHVGRHAHPSAIPARAEAGPPGIGIAVPTDGRLKNQMEGPPERKRPVHFPPQEAHNRSIIVFLTVCTDQRRALLANVAAHEHLRSAWMSATRWIVGCYLLMPDHVHLFCAPNEWPPPSLTSWVSFWKSRAAAMWPGAKIGRVWQRDGWDTQLRSGESYAEKWEYVRQNPVREGLVHRSEEWPYQGELNTLRWHD